MCTHHGSLLVLTRTLGMFQKFSDLSLTQTIMHVQEDEVYAVHVCANWHIKEAPSSYYSNYHFVSGP